MLARASYAVFTARADDPPPRLLADANVPRLDARHWRVSAVTIGDDHALTDQLRRLAFEREPAVPRRQYPTPHLYAQAVMLNIERADSLHPDALAFAVAAVAALVRWAAGPVVDLTAELMWTAREWDRKVADKAFDVDRHVSVHANWSSDGDAADVHTHGMVKFAHSDFAALAVPAEGARAAAQLLRHLARVRALTLEPLTPGHAFDPGFGQPMVAFVDAPPGHPVVAHLDDTPSVVVDYDVERAEAIDGLYGLLSATKALDRPIPAARLRRRLGARDAS
ncbi:MAG: hypothetical protein ABR520_07305 [Mycobacteriales bacterium]|nr:hypothetical protein [Frankia sp.]